MSILVGCLNGYISSFLPKISTWFSGVSKLAFLFVIFYEIFQNSYLELSSVHFNAFWNVICWRRRLASFLEARDSFSMTMRVIKTSSALMWRAWNVAQKHRTYPICEVRCKCNAYEAHFNSLIFLWKRHCRRCTAWMTFWWKTRTRQFSHNCQKIWTRAVSCGTQSWLRGHWATWNSRQDQHNPSLLKRTSYCWTDQDKSFYAAWWEKEYLSADEQ